VPHSHPGLAPTLTDKLPIPQISAGVNRDAGKNIETARSTIEDIVFRYVDTARVRVETGKYRVEECSAVLRGSAYPKEE